MLGGLAGRALVRGVVATALLFPAASSAQGAETTITSGPPAQSSAASATFEFSSDEPSATFQCKLDAEAFAACSSPHTVSALAEGQRTFSVRALGSTGGPDPTPASHTWTVDYGAPETVLDSAPAAATNSTTATFAFSSPDASASFQCSLNGGPWTACSSPHSYTGLSDGTRSFSVRALDQASNTDTTPPSHSWTVDATAPDTSITKGPAPVSKESTLWFSATEPSAFECAINSGLFMPCSTAQKLNGIPEGPVSVQVRAVDTVGNLDPTPAIHSWMLDRTPPAEPDAWVGPRPKKKLPQVKKKPQRARPRSRSAGKLKIPKLTRMFQKTSKLQLRWGGSDDDAVYDIRVKRAVLGAAGSTGGYKNFLTGVPAGKKKIAVPPGRTACFRVTARDLAGNKEFTHVCARVPYRAVEAKREGWVRRTNGKYLHRQYVKPTVAYPDNRITRKFFDPYESGSTAMAAKKVYLVVTRCPDCDKIRVAVSEWDCNYLGDDCKEKARGLRSFKLESSKTRRTQFLRVFKWKNSQNIHKVYITAFGKAKVEGFAFR